ncbi:MAG: phosphoadenosine phosphosulfate reductase family protein, partial [Flavobacteriales bacterium]
KTMDVWINGIRADQSANRNEMAEEEQAPHATLRYHPMLRWTGKMIYDYINKFNLPRHPLDEKGYHSIGCEPCTRRMDVQNDSDRGGRWFGLKKVECGLHTELVKKQ